MKRAGTARERRMRSIRRRCQLWREFGSAGVDPATASAPHGGLSCSTGDWCPLSARNAPMNTEHRYEIVIYWSEPDQRGMT
jgi:hypothetical protein